MKNILAENMLRFGPRNLSESEKRNLQRLVEADPGDPSQSTVNLTADITALKTACAAFNTATTKIYGTNPELFAVALYSTKNESFIHINQPSISDKGGAKWPYGLIGVNLATGEYRYYGQYETGPSSYATTNAVGNKNVVDGIVWGIWWATGHVIGDSRKLKENDRKTLIDSATTLFNTVDPIFKKLMGYKGYSVTTNMGDEVIISKTV